MKKNTKAFLGLVLGLVVIVGLTSVAFGQKGGRKQPPATWGVRIPAYGNLSGMGGGTHLYTNDDPNVNFSVTKEMTGQTVDYTSIRLFIFANAANDGCGNPLETYVSFFGVNFSELLESDEVGPGGVCGFPPCFNVGFPDCLPYFLNTDHPKQGYEHVLFGFRINADIDDETLFPMGQRVKYMGSGAITIYI